MTLKKIGRYNFEKFKRKIPGIERKTAILVANKAEDFFKDNFDRQGFLNRSLQRWERTRKERGKTLVDTGSLRRSITTTLVSFRRSIIETIGIPYAAVHNDGGRAGRNRSVKLPKRKFMGNSHKLENDSAKIYLRAFAKIV